MNSISSIYLAFIRRGPALHVLASSDGTIQNLRPIGWFTPDWEMIANTSEMIAVQVRHAAESGEMSVAMLQQLRSLGAYLFDELFPLDAKHWIQEQRDVAILLSLDKQLLDIPWELAHTGVDFLSVQHAVGRMVQLDQPIQTTYREKTDTPKALIIADPDGQLDEAYHEGILLHDLLETQENLALTLRASDVDATYLRRSIRDHEIVHFAGHIDEQGWRMADSYFNSIALERLSGSSPMPLLIFANGCGGAKENSGDEMLYYWLSSGVQHYIGPLFDLPDRLGRAFAVLFYDGLFSGMTIGAAMQRARKQLAEDHGEGTTPWGAYVLYGDPRKHYFTSSAQKQEIKQPVSTPTRLSSHMKLEQEVVRGSEGYVRNIDVERTIRVTDIGYYSILILLAALVALVAYF